MNNSDKTSQGTGLFNLGLVLIEISEKKVVLWAILTEYHVLLHVVEFFIIRLL